MSGSVTSLLFVLLLLEDEVFQSSGSGVDDLHGVVFFDAGQDFEQRVGVHVLGGGVVALRVIERVFGPGFHPGDELVVVLVRQLADKQAGVIWQGEDVVTGLGADQHGTHKAEVARGGIRGGALQGRAAIRTEFVLGDGIAEGEPAADLEFERHPHQAIFTEAVQVFGAFGAACLPENVTGFVFDQIPLHTLGAVTAVHVDGGGVRQEVHVRVLPAAIGGLLPFEGLTIRPDQGAVTEGTIVVEDVEIRDGAEVFGRAAQVASREGLGAEALGVLPGDDVIADELYPLRFLAIGGEEALQLSEGGVFRLRTFHGIDLHIHAFVGGGLEVEEMGADESAFSQMII